METALEQTVLAPGSPHTSERGFPTPRVTGQTSTWSGQRLPSLLIADDHTIFVEALRSFLEKTYVVIGTVKDGRTLVTEAVRLKPDVIVVDIGMPLLNGFDAACRIREQLPKVPLVFLTMHDDPNLAAAAMEMELVGFVLKQSGSKELLTALDQVRHGKSFVSPKIRSDDWVEQRSRVVQFSRDLTPRQRDVVQLFAEGYSIKEIAARLNLSPKTIEFHKHHIMTAFHLKTNADLVLFAIKQGLISMASGGHQASGGGSPWASAPAACERA